MNTKHFLSKLLIGVFLLTGIYASKSQTVFTVTSNQDHVPSIPGELRYAMERANEAPGTPAIEFNIPHDENTLVNIQVVDHLPDIINPMSIDGKGYIVIDGSNGNTSNWPNWNSYGIAVANHYGKSKIMGLQLIWFKEGIAIAYADSTEIRNCKFIAHNKGIGLYSSSYCIIKGNSIDSQEKGLVISSDDGKFSENNIIGGTEGCDRNKFSCVQESIYHIGWLSTNARNKFSGNQFINCGAKGIDLRGVSNDNIQVGSIAVSGCTVSGTSIPDSKIEVFSCYTNDKKNVNFYLTTVETAGNGYWSTNLSVIPYGYVCATVTDPDGNTSELSDVISITPTVFSYTGPSWEAPACVGTPITFVNTSVGCPGINYLWEFDDGGPPTANPTHIFSTPRIYSVKLFVQVNACDEFSFGNRMPAKVCPPPPCENCIGSFSPEAGDYIISAWVKKEIPSLLDVTYAEPQLIIEFSPVSIPSAGPFTGTGQIIEGWQRIENKFTIPANATDMKVKLNCATGNCLFDDIRIFPVNASMKSYVYDPLNLRLVAELDERNYSTFYEYDEEGKLVRVKKETEKGIMTIKENKNSTNKR